MKASQLRDLTRRYAGGEISREAYLAERMRLIDGVTSGEIDIHHRELESGDERKRKRARGWRQGWRYSIVTVFLVALLVIALLAYFMDRQPAAPEPAAQAMIGNPAIELLDEFIKDGNWSEDALSKFESRWQAVSLDDQQDARRSASFRRLKNETGKRIREQDALISAGEMEALLYIAKLRSFAQTMGFEN